MGDSINIRWTTRVLMVLYISSLVTASIVKDDEEGHIVEHTEDRDGSYYTSGWAVHVSNHLTTAEVKEMAEEHGFISNGKVFDLEEDGTHVYEFHHAAVPSQSDRASHEHHSKLTSHQHILHAEQQVAKVRRKRDFLEKEEVFSRSKRSNPFNDPLWTKTWYLNKGSSGGYDMNVQSAWKQGYTGKGVVITILDDGIERTHPDLQPNYDPMASYDVNNSTHGRTDRDPMPRYDRTNENRHGTRCAGEVSAVANNGVCSVGAAYHSSIGGVRMLDGDVTDLVEAQSLALHPQHIDIYSSSWGPDDDGRTLDGPGSHAKQAFIKGVTEGRGGKGNIFVWASGNGGKSHDSCACDGYTNSPYTLSVSAASDTNTRPWYLEECASTLATTYSSGRNYGQRKIVSTDLHHRCTETHSGTSAAAPLAAGLIALTLEANPDLTWRDMQYIVMLTANAAPLKDGRWVTNGVGRKVSHLYGYGLMDAGKMTALASRWTNVPAQITQRMDEIKERLDIGSKGLILHVTVPRCTSDDTSCVRHIESVQLVTSALYSRRGDLSLALTSPSGTRSVVLPRRSLDSYSRPINKWPFMSVHFWGEDPAGEWTVEVMNAGNKMNKGKLTAYQLVFLGTNTDPISNTCSAYMLMSNGDCVSECSPGLYADGRKVCHTCPSGCTSCSLTHTNTAGSIDCEDCGKGYSLLQHGYGRMCVKECPAGTVSDSHICEPCPSHCERCNGGDHSKCSHCDTGYDLLGHTCHKSCEQHQYRDEHDRCVACHSDCSTCVGPLSSDCTLCKPSLWLLEGSCYESCPTATFPAPINEQRCDRCHLSCSECYGPADNNCRVCPSLYYLTYLKSCAPHRNCSSGSVFQAPSDGVSGNFLHSDGTCVPCHNTCLTCRGLTERDCTACSDQRYLLDNRQCVHTCPKGHYSTKVSMGTADVSSISTNQTASSRSHDMGSNRTATMASEADDVSTSQEPSTVTNGKHTAANHSEATTTAAPFGGDLLTTGSPEGVRMRRSVGAVVTEAVVTGVCESCGDDLCEVCSATPGVTPVVSTITEKGTGKAIKCEKCYRGAVKGENGECQSSCSSGLYKEEDGVTNSSMCKPCSVSGCAVCHSRGTCILCADGFYHTSTRVVDTSVSEEEEDVASEEEEDETCSAVCPLGWYGDLGSRECKVCHSSCSTCTGGSREDCSECSEGRFKVKDVCEEKPVCHSDQYLNTSAMICEPCDQSCSTCHGAGSTSCLTCPTGAQLRPNTQVCVTCCSLVPDTKKEKGCCRCIGGMVDCSIHESDGNLSPHLAEDVNTFHRPAATTLIVSTFSIAVVVGVSVALILIIPAAIFITLQCKARRDYQSLSNEKGDSLMLNEVTGCCSAGFCSGSDESYARLNTKEFLIGHDSESDEEGL